MARQDPRHRGPKESKDAKHAVVLKLAQLRWTGHVIRMPDERLLKKVFYGELQEGKRSQGGLKKRYKDTLKTSLEYFDTPVGSWEQTAQERSLLFHRNVETTTVRRLTPCWSKTRISTRLR